jgi:vanillate O-demethylase monooxygenase subunit
LYCSYFGVASASILQTRFTGFGEDVALFEAQQRNLLLIPNPPQTDINADAGVIQARRILGRLYQEEQAAATVAAAE